ncbi:MAG: anthranilate synthase component I [Pelosinus sp.]|nr:anthranilate synthase component I [Pelosinus sp.]
MVIQPTREEFCELAKEYNVIPVFSEIATDMETPVSIYYKMVGEAVGFMLESAETGKNFGRYSFIGTKPFAAFTARGKGVEIIIDGKVKKSQEKPLDVLKDFINEFKAAPTIMLPMASGGAVGYFAYDIVATFERVRGYQIPDDFLLSQLLFCEELVVMDHLRHTSKLVALARITPECNVDDIYEETVKKLETIKIRLRQPQALQDAEKIVPLDRNRIHSTKTKEGFMEMVERAKEHIRAGDIFQMVPSQRLTAPLASQPFAMYRRLRRVNPSPYMFYFNFGERKLIGASPEILVKLEEGHVSIRPIAGSRPRGKDAAEDAQLEKELLTDKKELAEHTMLVDLARNDLGRVCVPGTVAVEDFMYVQMFSHIMHIVSDVGGTIKPEINAVDAFRACFPAGTLSGAPKVRAMELIYEFEKLNRGPYGGAAGYIDFSGNMDTCITIRSMVVDGDTASVQSGCGVVYDSVPEVEYVETLNKAGALLKVMTGEGDDA